MQFTRRRVLAFLVLSCILLLTLDARGSTTIDSAKSFFADVFSPLKGVGRMVSTPVRNGWKGVTNYDELERENDILRERIASQEGDSIASQAALRDYQELVAQLDLPNLRSFTNVTAQVLAVSPTNTQQTVEINRGSSKGIRVGMPVVNAAGLIGKVVEVFEDSSLVLLITDPSYSVTVRIVGTQIIEGTEAAEAAEGSAEDPAADPTATGDSVPDETESGTAAESDTSGTLPDDVSADTVAPVNGNVSSTTSPTTTSTTGPPTTLDFNSLPNRERGALEGIGSGKNPVVRFISNDNKARQIKVGDVVVTDGGSESLAPGGLNVGRVSSVTPRAGSQGPLIEVEPAADLSQVNYVRVIIYLPQSENTPG